MNAHAQRQAAPAAIPATPAAARQLAGELMEAMSALLGVIERETELVRAGKLKDAMALGAEKSDLSRRYVGAVGQVRANQKVLAQCAPDLMPSLHRHHDTFRAMLQINLTVLATAHAVSENIVRGVNAEMQRKNIPNTYTAAGRRTAPGPRHITPISVSRSL
jgi:hypothetical protein